MHYYTIRTISFVLMIMYTHVRTRQAYSGARCKFSCTCSPGGPWHSNSGVHELRWPPGGHALITHSLFDRHECLSSIFKCLLTSALRETSGRVFLCFHYIMLSSFLINNYYWKHFKSIILLNLNFSWSYILTLPVNLKWKAQKLRSACS